MSKATLTQFSFNRGELSPALHGRVDWKHHSSGAEKLRNLLVRPQGGAVKRGGLRLVAEALDQDGPARLIPFRFSAGQSYMLEFGHLRMRVIADGGVVVHPAGHGLAGREVVLDTPYPSDALPLLRHAQSADVMVLAHPGHPPQRLSRRDHHDWRLEPLFAGGRTAAPENLAVTASGRDNARYVVTAVSAEGGESAPTGAAAAAHPDETEPPREDAPYSELYGWLRERDPARIPEREAVHARPWTELLDRLASAGYATLGRLLEDGGYTWIFRRPGEAAERSLRWTDADRGPLAAECLAAVDRGWAEGDREALLAAADGCAGVRNTALEGTRITALSWRAAAGAESYRVYRDRSGGGFGPYSLIGETASRTFVDRDLPAQAGRLPEEAELFGGPGDRPGVCAFFEQRLFLGRSDNKPTTFWGSETGCYNSFLRHSPIEDSDSCEFALAGGGMDEIHWIVPLNEMLLGTSGGEWRAGGGDGGGITPSGIRARVQSLHGCAPLQPAVAGRTVVFACAGGRTLRTLSYSLDADGYAGVDLTAYAGHLFAGRSVVSLCHQREPAGIVWAVMSDGALLSCAYAPEEDVAAWSRHDTAGRFESCGAAAGGDGLDRAYFCVAREIGGATRRFIETMERAADQIPDGEDGLFLDCALTYAGPPAGTVSGLDHLDGGAVSVLADGCVFENVPVRGGRAVLPDGFAASVIHAGLPYAAELETLEMEPEAGETLRNRARFAVSAAVRLSGTRECLYSHSGGQLSEMKFRTSESPGRAARPFTGEKNIVFSSPPGARTAGMRLVSPGPVPFAVLGIVAEAACGQPS